MKLNYSIITTLLFAGTFSFATSANDVATKYIFKAMNNSLNTRICTAAANNDMPKLKQAIRKDKFGARHVTSTLVCNDKDVTHFAAQYNAYETAEYLSRRAPHRFKVNLDDVQIIDLAFQSNVKQNIKVIYISAK
ncbi:DUF3718 domain-containing protein [Thalassotalea sp. ND16A]|uniref:DUF3718 domain-containing protein n=1 Tax=Thalassotalea sp. ND16A TaxID=1535422 RepID=UPI00051A4701|nr:DUF3718 domain-containing protein [Thalassotalea sp. ND16A]KGJ95778.1 hypothetical protein ND16A_1313 [Thalassotalea sp. ND16A]